MDWQLGDLTFSSDTSLIEYDKEDWLDPDDSSFAVFNDHRLEEFEQFAQEFRLTSPLDQTFSWMVGAYFQQHDLLSRIDVYLPAAARHGGYQPAGARAVGFGGLLTEDSEWASAVLRVDVERVRLLPRQSRRPLSGREEGREIAGGGRLPRRARRRHSVRSNRSPSGKTAASPPSARSKPTISCRRSASSGT